MNRPIIFSRRALGALVLCMLVVSFPAKAQQNITALEIASLPQYCQDKLNRKNHEKWVSTFGRKNWGHFNHFCYGMIFFYRANNELNDVRRHNDIVGGIRNFDYVLQRWSASFPFYQQAQMWKQQLEMMQKYN